MFVDKPFIRLSERSPVIPINVAPHLQEYYARLNGQHGELIVNGIDTNLFYRRPHREHLNPVFTIFSTGAPHYWLKGQHFLSAAVNRFALSRPELPIRWIIASGADNDTDVSNLRQADNVTIEYLPGLTTVEVANAMRLSDVTVSPSLYEGFGLPAIEALACGVPVIATHSYGLDYILEHESNCLVVPAGNIEELQSALERVYSDGDLRRRLCKQGPRTASSFGLLPQFSQFTEAFERILDYRFDTRLVEEMKGRFSDRAKLPARIRNKISRTSTPLVSVVVPAFNRESLLGETLDSVLAQTCPDWEVVVVDDGSSDDTVRVAQEYASRDDRIRVVCHDRNQGISATLNTGIAESRGQFFCWLSSDDLFHHDKLRIQLEAFSKLPSNYGMIYSSFDERLEEKRRFNRLPLHQAVEPDFQFSEFLKFDHIHGCTTMIPLSILRELGGFCTSLRFAYDTEMWMRIAAAGYRFHYTPHKLLLNRAHPRQSSSSALIRCRFDYLVNMRFYLSRFSFLEVFGSVDIYRKSERVRLVNHIVSRFDHEEALIHHELLTSAFIDWLRRGLRMTSSEIQSDILRGIRDGLKNLEGRIAAVSPVIEELTEILEGPRREEPTIVDLRMGSRSPLLTDNAHVEMLRELFKWTCKVLLDRRTSRFGYLPGASARTNKSCEIHHWVANSAINYLAFWPEGGWEFLRPHSGAESVPRSDAEAEDLFIKIALPSVVAELTAFGSSSGRPWSDTDLERAAEHATPRERATALEVMSSVSLSTRMTRFYRALRLGEANRPQRVSSSFIPV
jgi:glycosyltransferase involved in cell wall biosynthesis